VIAKKCKKYSEKIIAKVKATIAIKDWREKQPQEDEIYLGVYDNLEPDEFDENTRDKLAKEVIKMARNNRDW